jgi:Transposase, Mutator family
LENFLEERRTALKRSYHTLTTKGQANQRRLTEFFSRNGQALLPMVELIEQSRLAVDELIDVAGRATIEAVLALSAEQVAGPRTPGQRRAGLLWHGRQAGRVCLQERKLGVSKPRLRKKGGGEVSIPAYEAMQENGISSRMLDVLMRGISTRQYAEVLPEMASTCGVSKSNVSREAAEAGEEALKELLERRFDDIDLLVIYIDGMVFGDYHVISAVGVDAQGHKHVLGIQQGATENAAAVEDLLQQLVARGVKPEAQRLFVIDGAKALRAAINRVFGPQHPVQRCRNHKIRNVVERLPEEQKEQVKAAMRASYRLSAKRRHVAAAQAGRLAGSGATSGGQQSARRAGRMFHPQPLGNSAVVASLPGHHQLDREPAVRCAPTNWPGVPLARRSHGRALGGSVVPGDGEKLPSHYGLEGPLATGSDLRKKSQRKRCGKAGGRVRCLRAPLFNL